MPGSCGHHQFADSSAAGKKDIIETLFKQRLTRLGITLDDGNIVIIKVRRDDFRNYGSCVGRIFRWFNDTAIAGCNRPDQWRQ